MEAEEVVDPMMGIDDHPILMNDDHPEPEHHHHDQHHHEAEIDVQPQQLGEFLDRIPKQEEIWQMKRASKRPSEWLKLLCREWAEENLQLVESTDDKFLEYKPYLKGMLTSQLLCRLCIPTGGRIKKEDGSSSPTSPSNADPTFDFWRILNIEDEFDKAYIIAQVERFCTMYHIRNNVELIPPLVTTVPVSAGAAATSPEALTLAVAAANGHYLSPDATAAAVVAAQLAAQNKSTGGSSSPVGYETAVAKAQRLAREAERKLEQERKETAKREQKRQSHERKIEKQREREREQMKKQQEKIAREQSREEKRKKKLEMREHRERFAQEQKEAALKRAAELVASNRVPIEITRGAAAAKEAAQKALREIGASADAPDTPSPIMEESPPEPVLPQQTPPNTPVLGPKKRRSAVVVSTASDLHQIVTHSKNVWAKYNAIAKEHNQKVNWITVAKELGIHVKVREKYARMHSRAEQRGFDWKANGHWKIKDHPEIFVEPTQAEQKARMPPPPPDTSRTVLISELDPQRTLPQAISDSQDKNDYLPDPRLDDADGTIMDHHSMSTDDDAVAAAAAVVDATGVGDHITTMGSHSTTDSGMDTTSYVADPTRHPKTQVDQHVKVEGNDDGSIQV